MRLKYVFQANIGMNLLRISQSVVTDGAEICSINLPRMSYRAHFRLLFTYKLQTKKISIKKSGTLSHAEENSV